MNRVHFLVFHTAKPPRLLFFLLLLACASVPLGAQTTVTVPGFGDLRLAGQSAGAQTQNCGSSAPLNSPAEVGIPLTAGQGLLFSGSGTVGESGQAPQIRPEGGARTTTLGSGFFSFAGIGDIGAPTLSLIGMFLGSRIDPAATPPGLDFTGGSRDIQVLRPLLQQPFFIGTGSTPDGTPRVVVTPAGAAHLFLGVTSRCPVGNTGSFSVRVSAVPIPILSGNPLVVPGVADLRLAGQSAGAQTQNCGSSAPLNSPAEVSVPLVVGQELRIIASGSMGESGQAPTTSPDGSRDTSLGSGFFSFPGIGDIAAPALSLIGLFLGNRIDPNNTPPRLDFTSPASRDSARIAPLLQQPFYIGSGYTAAATPKRIVVPPSAVHLYLGVTHRCAAENVGSYFATVSPDTPVTPQLTSAGIQNAAGFGPAPLSAGSVAAIVGSNLSAQGLSADSVPLPTSLAQTQVWVDRLLAPLFFVSPTQVNFQIPVETNADTAQIVVSSGNLPSVPVPLALSPYRPGIFTSGTTAIIFNAATGRLVGDAEPATAGDTLIIYATGLGPVSPTVPSGMPAPLDTLVSLPVPATVRFGNVAVSPDFAGLAPGFIGVFQINVRVPVGVSGKVQLELIVVGGESNTVSIPVQ